MLGMLATSKIVENVLETNEKARNSDNELFVQVVATLNPSCLNMPFASVLTNAKRLGIPQYETCRRSRQKLQETREDLRPSPVVEEERFNNFKEVLDYVSD